MRWRVRKIGLKETSGIQAAVEKYRMDIVGFLLECKSWTMKEEDHLTVCQSFMLDDWYSTRIFSAFRHQNDCPSYSYLILTDRENHFYLNELHKPYWQVVSIGKVVAIGKVKLLLPVSNLSVKKKLILASKMSSVLTKLAMLALNLHTYDYDVLVWCWQQLKCNVHCATRRNDKK